MNNNKTIENSLNKLIKWLEYNEYKGYDPFDGLSSYLNIFTFHNKKLQQILLQSVRRIPFNIRPIIGIKKHTSTKGMGFVASGYLNMYKMTNNNEYLEKAEYVLDWLDKNKSPHFENHSWGNNFNYASRAFYLPAKYPTLVWTALIGHAFIDAYEITKKEKYLNIIKSICNFIINDNPISEENNGICLSYITSEMIRIHNANLLGAGFLARANQYVKNTEYNTIAKKAIEYSCKCQLENGAWYYGEEEKYHWIDNWHTAYNLDSVFYYQESTNDKDFEKYIIKGYDFFINNFFEPNGAPKYYFDKAYKYDIQSASQAIDTLTFLRKYNKESINIAEKVAIWSIENMQNKSGYFYLWKNSFFTNKTPTFHWGNATMFRALSNFLLNTKGEL